MLKILSILKKKNNTSNSLPSKISYENIINITVGGKDLNFYVGPQSPFTNKNVSEEEKMFRKAP